MLAMINATSVFPEHFEDIFVCSLSFPSLSLGVFERSRDSRDRRGDGDTARRGDEFLALMAVVD